MTTTTSIRLDIATLAGTIDNEQVSSVDFRGDGRRHLTDRQLLVQEHHSA